MLNTRVRPARPPVLSFTGLFALLLLVACGLSAEERLARGQTAYTDGEFRAAAIDARSVLQAEPDNAEARLLLGRAALEIGDLGSADKELRRAIELGVPKGRVAVDLGRLLLAQQQHQQLLDELTPEVQAAADKPVVVMRLRAEAHLGLGNTVEARELYQAVLAADDRDLQAMLGIVSTYLAEERYEQARATLDEVRGIDADYVPAWLTSATMHMGMRNARRAEADFAKAAELAAAQGDGDREAAAVRGLVEARLARNDVDGAADALERLAAIAPDDIRTRFLQGRLAYVNRDWEAAQDHLQTVLRASENFRPAQVLLGAVHLSRGNLSQADMYLSAAVAASPDNADARRLLAETRMRQNNADAASAILQPLLAGEAVDSQSLAMAARANMAAGDYDAATELLKRRVDQEPTNSALQLDLAAAYLAAGDVAAAEAILAAGTDTTEADAYRRDMLGVMSRVRADDFEAAIAAARAMIADHPDDARLRNMLGGIYLAMDNDDAARAEFDAALAIEAGNRTALLNLGRMAASQGDYDAARGRFSTVLDAAPDDAGAMIALGMVEAADGNRQRSIEWLEKARAAAADNAMARTMLARQYLATEDFENAEAVATEAVTIAPQSAQAHAVLGAALEGQGDERGALESYRRATELDPDNTAYSLSYARAQLRAGQQTEAASTLERVESRGEPDLRASLQIAAMTASAGDVDRAIRMGEELMQQFPDSEMPHVLLGEIHFRNGNATEGAAQFERALDKRMSARIAGRAFTLRRANNVDPAERPLERFLEQNPDNETARLALAQHYQTSGNDERAATEYEAVLRQNPDNFTALNNLAWLYFTSGDSRAEALARRAYEAAPDNGSVADTLGWILVSNGSLDEGVGLLRRAVELSDGRATIRYHLAVGLAESGNTEEARTILGELVAGSAEFAERGDAEALLERL